MAWAGVCRWLAVLCCLLLFGCAGKLPKTSPLGSGEAERALDVWSRFLNETHPDAVDADYRLRWDVLGSKGGIDAVVQLKRPAMLRFSANDPLGRALILVVSDGTRFTFVDNRAAEVFQGKTMSKFWYSYVPESIRTDDLFAYLGGFVDRNMVTRVDPSLDEKGLGYWYVWQDERALTHYVLLESGQGGIQRHLLVDSSGDLVLDLRYSGVAGSAKDAEKGFRWPEKVEISGEAITGDVALQVEKIYAFSVRGTGIFHLTPPPHFSIKSVQ